MTDDPRIDPLGNTAILTDTQMRLAFAPRDPKAKVVGMALEVRKAKLDQIAALMQLGTFHIQLKSGFEAERHYTFKPEEVPLLLDALDKMVTELPRAQAAAKGVSNDD